MRITLCAALLLAVVVSAMAQEDQPNHFVGYGYINTALPITDNINNTVSFIFVMSNKEREFGINCVARGPAARYIKESSFRYNERYYCTIVGMLARRHSRLCIVVTSVMIATPSSGEHNN